VLSGTGLGVELITRPEESYRVWCHIVGKKHQFSVNYVCVCVFSLFIIEMVVLVVGKLAVVKQDKRQVKRKTMKKEEKEE
jgi:hypothetical protein